MSFEVIADFEKEIAKFFGAPYAVAVDCCTHGLELCLRMKSAQKITVPKHTYLSVPMLAEKLDLEIEWTDDEWQDYYYMTDDIVDAAVYWQAGSYIPGTYMCVSFQFRKHLSLGRGGIILFDNKEDYDILKKMSYDGRLPDKPWRDQDISSMGYHYYMTPETAQNGLDKLEEAKNRKPRQWEWEDWPDLRNMEIFKNEDYHKI